MKKYNEYYFVRINLFKLLLSKQKTNKHKPVVRSSNNNFFIRKVKNLSIHGTQSILFFIKQQVE